MSATMAVRETKEREESVKRNPKKVIARTGRTKKMPLPIYPKVYEVRIEYDLETDMAVVKRRTEGFSAWELYGMLNILMKEIERQLLIKPEDELKID
jgi:hypothetical protein